MTISAQEKRAITVEDMWQMKRIGTVTLSPADEALVFSLTSYDMETNGSTTDLYKLSGENFSINAFKNSDKSESGPVFSPDGSKIAFIKDSQIWTADPDGANEKQLTDLHTGASGVVWSPDGTKMLFVSKVYPECADQACNKEKDEAREKSLVKAEIFTELMYRHWNGWRGPKRSHLFLLDLESGEYTDLTLFSESDVPPLSLGGAQDYTFSPDGKEVAFTLNEDEFLATSTNNDVFVVSLDDVKKGEPAPRKKISTSGGVDNTPVYSPDGKYIAFLSMERAGFEADKKRLMLYDRESGEMKNLTAEFDASPAEMLWCPESKHIFFTATWQVTNAIFKINIETSEVTPVLDKYYNSNLMLTEDGSRLYFKQQRAELPYEIFSIKTDGTGLMQVSHVNSELLAELEMNSIETFWTEGAEGAKVQSILLKPPFFEEGKEYPMIFLIHGGPQGAWSDDFHYRWNLQMFASRGYVVVAPNPRGSTGYGQKFTDEISQDWGGKVYTDLMNAYDFAVEEIEFIDGENTFAAGASYGGYMINWLAGHTNRFNALVSHAGVFNLESMYGTTEELWFPEWELGGTPWENRELYERFSPHRYIHNAETPMLVVHGAYDFRVPEEQAFQLFTSLQRLGVESKFLYFPDETHFVVKPQNARLWWNTVLGWYEEHKE